MSDIKKASSTDLKKKKLQNQLLVIGIIAVICVICHFLTGGRLLMPTNIRTILTQWTYPLMVGLGMMFIFTSGMIDLSIGAQLILAGNVGAIFVEDFGLSYPGLIIGTIVAMIICELISVSCSTFLGIPSWVAGLGAALVYEAVAVIITNERAKTAGASTVYLKQCRALGTFPWIFIIAIIVFIVVYFLFNRSTLGFNLRAVGSSPEVAEAMGIKRRKTIMLAALIGAVVLGIAAITQLSYTSRYTAMSGMGSLAGIFKALATVLFAGSFSKIFSDPVGVAVGSFIITILFNILTLFGVPSGTYQEMCLGAVVILCGILSSFKNKGVVK